MIDYLPSEVARGAYFFRVGLFFGYKVFFRMYLPLVLEVYFRVFIDCLGFMSVDKTKKHLFGLTLSKTPLSRLFCPHPPGLSRNKGHAEYRFTECCSVFKICRCPNPGVSVQCVPHRKNI